MGRSRLRYPCLEFYLPSLSWSCICYIVLGGAWLVAGILHRVASCDERFATLKFSSSHIAMFDLKRGFAFIWCWGVLVGLISATIDPLEVEGSRFVYKSNGTVCSVRYLINSRVYHEINSVDSWDLLFAIQFDRWCLHRSTGRNRQLRLARTYVTRFGNQCLGHQIRKHQYFPQRLSRCTRGGRNLYIRYNAGSLREKSRWLGSIIFQ